MLKRAFRYVRDELRWEWQFYTRPITNDIPPADARLARVMGTVGVLLAGLVVALVVVAFA